MPLLDERNRALVVEVRVENDNGKLALVSTGRGKEIKEHLTTHRSLYDDKHDAWCAARRLSARKRGRLRDVPPSGGNPKAGSVLARSKEGLYLAKAEVGDSVKKESASFIPHGGNDDTRLRPYA
jgi:hypothetical protein